MGLDRDIRKAEKFEARGDANAAAAVVDGAIADDEATDAYLTGNVDEAVDATVDADIADREARTAAKDYAKADQNIDRALRRQ